MQTTNVPIGIGSIVGFVAAAAAAVAPLLGQLADATQPLGVPPQTWVHVSAALTAVTVLGRMWQAAAAAGQATTTLDDLSDPLPDEATDVPEQEAPAA